jgi:HK97 family phage major capsid protein
LGKHKTGRMPAEDQKQFDAMMADANALTVEIEQRNSYDSRRLALEQAENWGSGVRNRDVAPNGGDPGNPNGRTEQRASGRWRSRVRPRMERRAKNPDHVDAFEAYLSRGIEEPEYRAAVNELVPIEYRDILAGTSGQGGSLIPPVEFIDQILIPRDRQVLIRKWATVRRLTKSTDGYQPTIETNPDDADWTSEITAVTADGVDGSGMTTGKRELKPNVLTKLVKVSVKELMVLPQVSELIADRLGYKFGVTEEKAFLAGNGQTGGTNAQPLGVFTLGTSETGGIQASSDVNLGNTETSLTMVGLQNAKFTLPPPYWANARWVMSNVFMLQVATLTDTLGRFLWQPNTQVGQPDMLLGFPCHLDVWAPTAVAPGAYGAILGDFSYYHIADLVEPFSVQRLNEHLALTNEVGFLGREYCDGMPVMSEAFVRAQLAPATGAQTVLGGDDPGT